MEDLKLVEATISSKLDKDGEINISPEYGLAIYINKQEAEQIIEHLKKVFDID